MIPNEWCRVFTTSGSNSFFDLDVSEYEKLKSILMSDGNEVESDFAIEVKGLHHDKMTIVVHTIEAISIQTVETMQKAWIHQSKLENIRKEIIGDMEKPEWER